jgi:hypothetical protein
MTKKISAIKVVCNYGAGDRPLDAITDSLIITQTDAVNRGYAELNKAWKIIDTYTATIPYPDDGHSLEVGKFVKVIWPELALTNQVLYIAGVSQRGTNTGTVLTLRLERYEDFE